MASRAQAAVRGEPRGGSAAPELQWAADHGLVPQIAGPRPRRLSPNLAAGLVLVSLVVLMAVFAPVLAPAPPDLLDSASILLQPSPAHPLGTDSFGRDLFSRLVYGARLALGLTGIATLFSAVPGLLLGMAAGYYRGWVDQVLSRFMDAWLALPGLLLALVIIARTGPSLEGAILALGLSGIPGFYRLVRANTISICVMPYMEASRSVGVTHTRQIFRHVLPNLMTSVLVLVTLRLGTYLLAGSSLSFIGLGAQTPQPEWGALLAEGRDYLDTAWWMFVFPGLAITLTVIGFNLLGDGLRDRLAGK